VTCYLEVLAYRTSRIEQHRPARVSEADVTIQREAQGPPLALLSLVDLFSTLETRPGDDFRYLESSPAVTDLIHFGLYQPHVRYISTRRFEIPYIEVRASQSMLICNTDAPILSRKASVNMLCYTALEELIPFCNFCWPSIHDTDRAFWNLV
jgi:hypothetical protein